MKDDSGASDGRLDQREADNSVESLRGKLRTLIRSPRFRWTAGIALFVAIAIVVGFAITQESPEARAPVEVQEAWKNLDTDGDGIEDVLETKGWKTEVGDLHQTDPAVADSDGDGLEDGEEAGDVVSGAEFERVYVGISNPTMADSDDDGLDDKAEVLGWTIQSGAKFFTGPLTADSDGDGLFDGEEAGERVVEGTNAAIHVGFSDPTQLDTDDDGLEDADEADNGLDAFKPDTDDDGLTDAYEVNQIGTNPMSADSDGDGFDDQFEDLNRVDRGIDPLFVDVETSAWDYAGEFVLGALAGEVVPGDSVAWLSGNIVSGGLSFIPGVGWVAGGVADLRDTIGALIHADWVGAGFSAVGLIPYGGDSTAIPAKVGAFVAQHPELAAAVGAMIVVLNKVPTETKINVSKKLWPEWDNLVSVGANEKGLLRLQKSSRVNLDSISHKIRRDGHLAGPPAPFMADGPAGEKQLEKMLRKRSGAVDTQVRASTAACVEVCNDVARRFDVVANGTAHESKVGYTSLTTTVKSQIESDAFLIKNGAIQNAHWHFYASGITNQIGPSKPLLNFLDSKGIKYTIHLPSKP